MPALPGDLLGRLNSWLQAFGGAKATRLAPFCLKPSASLCPAGRRAREERGLFIPPGALFFRNLKGRGSFKGRASSAEGIQASIIRAGAAPCYSLERGRGLPAGRTSLCRDSPYAWWRASAVRSWTAPPGEPSWRLLNAWLFHGRSGGRGWALPLACQPA